MKRYNYSWFERRVINEQLTWVKIAFAVDERGRVYPPTEVWLDDISVAEDHDTKPRSYIDTVRSSALPTETVIEEETWLEGSGSSVNKPFHWPLNKI